MSEERVSLDPVDEQSKTEGESWVAHFFKAAGYSVAGIGAALRHEMAFRMEVAAVVLLAPVSILLPIGLVFKALLLSSMFLVLVTELLNSSIEWVVDYISTDRHPLAKRAKDIGSAAVLFALVNSGVMWGLALWEWWTL
jgi:diacylglycerol kinase (ATP)